MRSLSTSLTALAVTIIPAVIRSVSCQPLSSTAIPPPIQSAVSSIDANVQLTNASAQLTNTNVSTQQRRAWPPVQALIFIPNTAEAWMVFTSLTPPFLNEIEGERLRSMIADKRVEWIFLPKMAALDSFTVDSGDVRLLMVTNKDPSQPQLSRDTGEHTLELFAGLLDACGPLNRMAFDVLEGVPKVKRASFVVQRMPPTLTEAGTGRDGSGIVGGGSLTAGSGMPVGTGAVASA